MSCSPSIQRFAAAKAAALTSELPRQTLEGGIRQRGYRLQAFEKSEMPVGAALPSVNRKSNPVK
jgi:hypothetical protein